MIINNQKLLPSGTVMMNGENGQEAVGFMAEMKNHDVILPSLVHSIDDMANLSFKRNFYEEPDRAEPPSVRYHQRWGYATENHEANKRVASKWNYEQQDVCLICGGGPSSDPETVEKYRGQACFVSLSRAQDKIPGDYYVGLEMLPHDYLIDETKCAETTAHLMTICNKDVPNMPWKNVTFGVNGFLDCAADVPRYHNHATVSCVAIEFACKVLGAKKVIMIGMEHPVTKEGNYYWHGLEVQIMSWFACRNGVDVWNCTPATTVTNGVKLATLDEAFAG